MREKAQKRIAVKWYRFLEKINTNTDMERIAYRRLQDKLFVSEPRELRGVRTELLN
jgi:hypothetical protein